MFGIGVGVGTGTALGVALHSSILGLSLGTGIGIAMASAFAVVIRNRKAGWADNHPPGAVRLLRVDSSLSRPSVNFSAGQHAMRARPASATSGHTVRN